MSIVTANPSHREDIQRLSAQIFNFENQEFDATTDVKFPNTSIGQNFYDDIVKGINGHFGYVYDDDGVVKGYVSLRVVMPHEICHRKDVRLLQMQNLCVDERYRGKGIGRKLVEHAKAIAKDLGFSHLKVVSLAKNDRARHLYQSCEFDEYEVHHEIEL